MSESLIIVEDADIRKGNSRCSVCQMPLRLLLQWESATVHASNCVETDFKSLSDCQLGAQCDVTIRNHYLKFNHFQLASSQQQIQQQQQTPPTHQNLIEEALGSEDNEDNFTKIKEKESAKRKLYDNNPTPGPSRSLNFEGPDGDDEDDFEDALDKIIESHLSEEDDQEEEEVVDRQKVRISSTDTETIPTESDDVNSPIKIKATEASDGFLNIKLKVDEGVALKTLNLKIPTHKSTNSDVISSKATTATAAAINNKKQSTLANFFNFGGTKSKGFIVPKSPMKIQQKSESTTTTTTRDSARQCPFYKKDRGDFLRRGRL